MAASTVLYTTYPSPLGELLLVGDGRSLTGLYMQAQKYAREVQDGWRRDATAVPRRRGAARRVLRRRTTHLRSLVGASRYGLSAHRLARAARSAVRHHHDLRRTGAAHRFAERAARRRTRERPQPDRHHRAVPSHHRRERQPHRLRRRHRTQTLAARARSAMELRTDVRRRRLTATICRASSPRCQLLVVIPLERRFIPDEREAALREHARRSHVFGPRKGADQRQVQTRRSRPRATREPAPWRVRCPDSRSE